VGLLVENNFTENPSMVAATQAAIESYAASIVRSPTEVIFALGVDGRLSMQTGELEVRPAEQEELPGAGGRRTAGSARSRRGWTRPGCRGCRGDLADRGCRRWRAAHLTTRYQPKGSTRSL